MVIEVATDHEKWNFFLKQNPRDGLFLQSWEWGELLIQTGQQVKRLQVIEDGSVVAQVQLVAKKLPFGWSYAMAGKGPVFSYKVSSIWYRVYDLLTEHLKEKGVVFIRIEPQYQIQNTKYKIHTVIDINPPATLVLDITPDESQLLANMHEKTRYNIRLAEKKGLRVTEEKNFEIFWSLLQKTGERDDFALHSKESYEKIMASDAVRQIIVWSGETPVATAGLIGFHDTMYYLYGASDHMYRNLMGPHLMQWKAIKLARKLGCKKYDFFGISPSIKESGIRNQELGGYEYDHNHRYAGVTRFKLGFGGQVHEEPGTFDLILSPWRYRVYMLIKKIRRFI